MEQKTFILCNAKVWKRDVKVFVLNKDKKYEKRSCTFKTDHLVTDKQRTVKGRKTHAQYSTSNQVIIDALFADSAYGKDFTLEGDLDGNLKTPTLVVSEEDKKLVAIRGLFLDAGLEMNESLPYNVLEEQYQIHMRAMSGVAIGKSTASEIPHSPVNPLEEINKGVNDARQLFVDKYGKDVPEIVFNDKAFLSALSDPSFDALKYIEEKESEGSSSNEPGSDGLYSGPKTKEALHAKYSELYGESPARPKSNDLVWIEKRINTKLEEQK